MITRPITRPVTSPIARAVNNPHGIWNPRALFALGEPGFWYDTNDLSTLFQDSAGTTPVTAAGQPVGLMLDNRHGLVRGPAQSIYKGAAWTGSGSGPYTREVAAFSQLGAFVAQGRWYEVSFRVDAITAGSSLTIYRKNATNTANEAVAILSLAPGITYRALVYVIQGTTPNNYDIVIDSSTFAGTISSVSIRELTGNHAFQSTAASRPILRDTPRRIDYDGVDDVLNTTFPSSLGSNCTVARSIPGVGAQILTGQTIGTSFADNVDSCAIVVINRALTAAETANLINFLNVRAGV